ncbi:MAG: hypothetical protein JW825_03345, partial [Candidatus Methanofastidiosa archaeon]|nr:hypothetical protein [Candidatus Methanofastidiosa archaeon]
LLFRSHWDDASEAIEFKDMYLTYISSLEEGFVELEGGPGHIVFESASGTIGIRWEDDVVTIISGNTNDLVMDYL